MIPYGDDQDQVEFPWATVALMGLCVAVYIWQYHLTHHRPIEIDAGFGMIPARLTGHLQLPPGIPHVRAFLTPLTAAFLHGGFFHLLGNMIFLWAFGKRIEDSFGKLFFILFVVVACYMVGLVDVAVHSKAETISVGASGFIAAIMGAYLAIYPSMRIHVVFFTYAQGVTNIRLPAWLLLGAWILLQIAFATNHDALVTHVGYLAHITGFIAGAVLARLMSAFGFADTYEEAAKS